MAMSKKNANAKSQEELLKEALVPSEEQPYEVPRNWVWVKLGGIVDFKGGGTPSKDIDLYWKGDIPWASVKDIKGLYLEHTQDSITEEGFRDSSASMAVPGELLLITRMSPGKSLISRIRTAINQDLKIVKPKIELLSYLLWMYFTTNTKIIEHMSTGSTVKGIQINKLKEMVFPLPPINEQKRIADKVERLLGKINQAKHLIEEAKATFELRRAAILDKAFRGELTKKWREGDQDKKIYGGELYQLIKNNRLENIESNRELKEVLQMFEDSNLHESIDPNGWIHLKANMFCVNINCGRTPSEDISDTGEVPFLKVYNIVDNKIDFEYKPQFIPKEVSGSSLGKSKLLPNDIIMNIVGPPLKKIAIIPSNYPEWNMNQAIVRFRPLKYVLTKYLYYCLQFDDTLKEVINETRGVVGQSNISVNQSRNLSMPIPSVEEQHEIVNVLEKLIEKENLVLDNLTAKKDELDKLTQSILNKAFKGSLGTVNTEDELAINLLTPLL